MKAICEPALQSLPSTAKRTLIVNSILHEKLVLTPVNGYFFYQNYPKLAEESSFISIRKEDHRVLDELDYRQDEAFIIAASDKLEPLDVWAAHFALVGKAGIPPITKFMKKGPVVVLKELREFYEKKTVKTFKFPFSNEEANNSWPLIDQATGYPMSKYANWVHSPKIGRDKQLIGSATCAGDLWLSKLFNSHGYAYVPSHKASILKGYSQTFLKINEEMRRNAKLSEVFKSSFSEKALVYLLGNKVGELNELLGFTPLNPLNLVPKETSNEQLDHILVQTRKDCRKIRRLFEKIHVNCIKKEIEKAIDGKHELSSMRANQAINFSILDNAGEFMERRYRDNIHGFIDEMFKAEMNSDVARFHKVAKKLNTRFGWISEVKFLTFGALLILAAYGIDSSYIRSVYDALGTASLAMGGTGLALKIIEEGMKLHPGFNLYASFVNWPRIT